MEIPKAKVRAKTGISQGVGGGFNANKPFIRGVWTCSGRGGGEVGLTSDLKWETDETLLLVSLYFFGKKLGGGGGRAKASPDPWLCGSCCTLSLNP